MQPPPPHLLPSEGYKSWTGTYSWTIDHGIKTITYQYHITKLDGSVINLPYVKKEDIEQLQVKPEEVLKSDEQLKKAGHFPLNEAVLKMARENYMKKIGDGQCYALGQQLLAAAGAKPPSGTVFGKELSKDEMKADLTGVLPGDIVQFSWARFQGKKGTENYFMTAGNEASDGKHTAVVFYCGGEQRLVMLEQNISGLLAVSHREYNFNDLKSGSFKIYRPQPL